MNSAIAAAVSPEGQSHEIFPHATIRAALSIPAEAKQTPKIPRIGFLSQAPPAGLNIEAFRQGLRERGYVEGKTIVIEYRDAEGKPDRLPGLASDLVRLKVNGIVVVGSEAALAAKNATTVIPIIMAAASDPVGLDSSLVWRDRGKHYGVKRLWSRVQRKAVRTAQGSGSWAFSRRGRRI